MIVRDFGSQSIACDLCGEVTQLSRRTSGNPETMMMLAEELRADHKDCERYKHDPRVAALQRGFKVRARREQAKQKPGPRGAREFELGVEVLRSDAGQRRRAR